MTVGWHMLNPSVVAKENLPFGEGKQSAWPPMAVSAQKNAGSSPHPLTTGGNAYA